MQVHLERGLVADDEHGVAELLERVDEARRAEAAADDGEVGAEAVGAGAVLRVGDARGRVVVEWRRLLAAQRGDDAGEDDREAVSAGVDDAGFAQRGEQLGAALDGVLAGLDGALERGGDRDVLLARLGGGPEARGLGDVRDVGDDLVRHLAGDGEDRALGGVAHGGVGAVGGVGERGADQASRRSAVRDG